MHEFLVQMSPYFTVAKNYGYIDIEPPNNHCPPVRDIVHENWFSAQIAIIIFEKRAQVKDKRARKRMSKSGLEIFWQVIINGHTRRL